jgi:hypothetical protein
MDRESPSPQKTKLEMAMSLMTVLAEMKMLASTVFPKRMLYQMMGEC